MSYEHTTHKVNLTGSEISTILFYLQQAYENNMTDNEPEIDRVFAELQSVTDNYFAYQEELDRVKQSKFTHYTNC